MERLWGLVLVLLGFVVLVNAGPVGLWTLLYVNTTQPQHN
jgi:ABC-type tungstate transport system substrate-binding protein